MKKELPDEDSGEWDKILKQFSEEVNKVPTLGPNELTYDQLWLFARHCYRLLIRACYQIPTEPEILTERMLEANRETRRRIDEVIQEWERSRIVPRPQGRVEEGEDDDDDDWE